MEVELVGLGLFSPFQSVASATSDQHLVDAGFPFFESQKRRISLCEIFEVLYDLAGQLEFQIGSFGVILVLNGQNGVGKGLVPQKGFRTVA